MCPNGLLAVQEEECGWRASVVVPAPASPVGRGDEICKTQRDTPRKTPWPMEELSQGTAG